MLAFRLRKQFFEGLSSEQDTRYDAAMRRAALGPSALAEAVNAAAHWFVDAGYGERYASLMLDPAITDMLDLAIADRVGTPRAPERS